MNTPTITALRVVIAIALAGSVVVQIAGASVVWNDLDTTPLPGRLALVAFLIAGVATLQLFAVGVWMLLTKVRRGSIFSATSFRWVNVIIAAIAAASVLMLALGAALAPGDTAPGMVALIGGVGVVLAGMALLVVVMKALLRQAIARDAEATALRSELDDEVI